MLSVSIIIPAWNEEEHIADCLLCATRQTVPAGEILVVDNNSTDRTVSLVNNFIATHPQSHVRLLHQNAEQGLIPTRNWGLNHAHGDILGRVDADSMLRPDWVEEATRIFTTHPDVMGATGPVAYYDMPAAKVSLRADNIIRRHIYKADGGQSLLFGSNMALRASAWKAISGEVCRDRADVMHEDIDVSLHLFSHNFRTYYSRHLVVAISARRMDTSFKSFSDYMDRFHNTFAAHPTHFRTTRPEVLLTAMYPWLHMMYPDYQRYLRSRETNPAEKVWEKQQMELLDDQDEVDSEEGAGEDIENLDEQTAMDSLSSTASRTNSFFAELFKPTPGELARRQQKREIRRQKTVLREESKKIRTDMKETRQKIRSEKREATEKLKARSRRVRKKIRALNKKSSRL